MNKKLLTVTAIIAVLFSTATTSMAQERKHEQKMRVIMADEKSDKPAIDTVYNLNDIKDTIRFSGNQICVYKDLKTGERKLVVMKGMHGRGPMSCEPGMEMRREMMDCCGEGRMKPGMHPGKGMTPPPADKNMIFYNISIDGVTVTVTAPKEKSKEADLIISDIQKILNTGK